MKSSDEVVLDRTELGFADVVRQGFAFVEDFGFREVDALPTIVRYRKDDLVLNVFHGRQSYEISMEIGRDDEMYSLSSLISAADPEAVRSHQHWAATTPEALASGVARLATLVRCYGARALRDDPAFFADLRKQRKSWSNDFALDVLARQIRPKAAAAFRERRYGEAAELYEKISARLSGAERAKLAFCRKRT